MRSEEKPTATSDSDSGRDEETTATSDGDSGQRRLGNHFPQGARREILEHLAARSVAMGVNGFLAEDGTRRCSVFKFENLDAWKVSVERFRKVVTYTNRLTSRNHFYLTEQIRRAALSICSNIAEGTGREGIKESRQFFNIAKGSVYEVVSIAYVLQQENLFTPEAYGDCYRLCDRIAGMLSGLIAKRQPK
jgi:four helix bundle protein